MDYQLHAKYPACSGIGRRSLVLRHAAPHFRQILKLLSCDLSRMEIEPTTLCVYSHTLVHLRHDSPQT